MTYKSRNFKVSSRSRSYDVSSRLGHETMMSRLGLARFGPRSSSVVQGCEPELELFAELELELEKSLSFELEQANILGRELGFDLEDILRKLEFIFTCSTCSI